MVGVVGDGGGAGEWGLDGLLSSRDGSNEEVGEDEAVYQPRLTLGRRDDDDDDDALSESDAEEEEGDDEAHDGTSLWSRVATDIRVRWLLWRNRARYRLRQGSSAGGGGKRYI